MPPQARPHGDRWPPGDSRPWIQLCHRCHQGLDAAPEVVEPRMRRFRVARPTLVSLGSMADEDVHAAEIDYRYVVAAGVLRMTRAPNMRSYHGGGGLRWACQQVK